MTDNTPGVEATEPWLVTPQDGITLLNWFRDELNKVRAENAALVESRDALSVKCEGLEGHYQELDYMLDEVKADRDQAVKECNQIRNGMRNIDDFVIGNLKRERDELAAQLSTKCGCVLANVSDGPHPELAAKDRMYATEVCWYHRFVHEERDALSVKCDALEGHYQELDYMLDDVKSEREAAIAERDAKDQRIQEILIERDAAFNMGQRYGEAGQKSIDPLVNERDALEIKCEELTAQNAELRAAFIGEGLCSNQPAHWCRNCLVWGIDPEPIAHKPDCIITRLEEK